ncbi:hypothetical protein [Flavobacterium psychrotrophum]|uniref:hypothetical protein n=1 Tax=Flavobacterium psychrotrophum TaxID=2294119 RepID=UPI000E3134DD|nr:hypothetical protein [Flavobacterium psychrotrophum]
MSRRIHVSLNDELIEGRLANKVKIASDLIAPQNFALIAGRGGGKTTSFVAERLQDVCYDMPGCYQAFVADTYVNAIKNVLPTLIDGWNKLGWKEGIHYVTDTRPPSHFALPYKPPLTFKHSISIFNGCFFYMGSLDQPSGLAGNSYQHITGDEARLLKFDKLKRLTPALRGEFARFGHSPYYTGRTFTTDMPNILSGDHDWIWEMQKEMDVQRVELALQIGLVLNEVKCELYNYSKAGDVKKIAALKKQVLQWKERWIRARMGLTFFYVVSSFINADILTEGFFTNNLAALGLEEFKSAILSFKIDLKKGEKFYGNLGDHHFFDDGINSSYYDRFKLTDEIQESSQALRYINHNAPLEGGIDFGDMCSLITGQTSNKYAYGLKDFHTLAPESTAELAKKFCDFYSGHKYKSLDLYYDRSGNQYAKLKRDWASSIKTEIEKYDSRWTVRLMSVGQGNIEQEEEYRFMKELLAETNPKLPKLRMDLFGCRHAKASLELTKILVKTNNKGVKQIFKDKSTEKLPLASRPLFSTNFSDAVKYWLCRKEFLKHVNRKVSFANSDPTVG